MSGKLDTLFRIAIGNFRGNKAAAFTHGLRVIGSGITAILFILGILTITGEIQPIQFIHALGYSLLLFFFDYAIISDIALWFRFVGPELFGFLGFSSLVNIIIGIGAISITLRWWRSE